MVFDGSFHQLVEHNVMAYGGNLLALRIINRCGNSDHPELGYIVKEKPCPGSATRGIMLGVGNVKVFFLRHVEISLGFQSPSKARKISHQCIFGCDDISIDKAILPSGSISIQQLVSSDNSTAQICLNASLRTDKNS